MHTFKWFILIVSLNTTCNLISQKATLSGYVKDAITGEMLIGVNINLEGTYIGTATNEYGFYSLTLNKGKQTILANYIGYQTLKKEINLQNDMVLNIELNEDISEIQEIVVSALRENENVVSSNMSMVKLSAKTIQKIPVLMGETDIIKTLQLLPGIKSTGGLSAGMSVRGGSRDQNLILLDEANVYNASHLGGLFSVFNNDAIKNVDIYKGSIPAEYGGRLSSVLDIRMKDGNNKSISANGGIGLLSSRLTIEAPIVKDKSSFILSGRRTYMDVIVKGIKNITKNENITEFPIHFYDLNTKLNYTINQDNRLYLSGYFGRDVFAFSFNENASTSFDWGNYTGTLRWNHLFSSKLFSNYTILASNYDYLMNTKFTVGRDEKIFSFNYDAFIKDYGAKIDFGYYLDQDNTIRFGLQSTYHDINVGEINGRQDTIDFDFKLPSIPGVETSMYARNEQKLGEQVIINYGVRYSTFFNPGNNTINIVDENYIVTGEREVNANETFYHNLEPRLSGTYIFNEKQSIKASYARTAQYMLIASNSTTGNPLDVWISANPNIKPQLSNQYTVGYFRNFHKNTIEASAELYYKQSKNQVSFREFAQPQFNEFIEEDLRFGEGKAYGIELLLRKPEGRLNGWIGYEYSKSLRKMEDIQEKNWFPSPYDSPHDLTIVAIFELNKKINISANWLIKSGQPLNAPAMRYEYGDLVIPYYPGRNQDRLPAYHRMDLGITINEIFANKGKKYEDEFVISIYNVYFRKNPDVVYFDQDIDVDFYKTTAYRVTYIPFLPAFTYNFKF